jgi:hypothetical protein
MAANCECAEKAALVRRVFVVDAAGLGHDAEVEYRTVVRKMGWALSGRKVMPVSLDDAVQMLSSAKRKRYLEARESLRVSPVWRRDAQVSMFVKADKVDHVDSGAKKPRAIQGRSPRYNLALARYMKPIEHSLMVWKGLRRGVPRTRVFAKGLDSRGRASLVLRKCANFSDPVVVSLDAHSMDASVLPVHLLGNDHCYVQMCGYQEFRRLLSWRDVNHGRTASGLKYTITGNRMSGDLDTGIGNSLISYAYITASMRYLGIAKWDILCDGDDVLLFFDRRANMMDIKQACFRYGFDVDGDVVVIKKEEDYCNIEFCRSKLVWTPRGWNFCRNPARALCCFGVTHRFAMCDIDVYRRYLRGCAMCESHCSFDLPLLGPWAWDVYRSLEGKPILDDEDMWRGGVHLKDPRAIPSRVHRKTRRHFQIAFGLSPEQQTSFEAANYVRIAQLFMPEETDQDCVVSGDHHYWLHDTSYLA